MKLVLEQLGTYRNRTATRQMYTNKSQRDPDYIPLPRPSTHSSAAQLLCLASGSRLRNPAAGTWAQLLAGHRNLSVKRDRNTLKLIKQGCPIRPEHK